LITNRFHPAPKWKRLIINAVEISIFTSFQIKDFSEQTQFFDKNNAKKQKGSKSNNPLLPLIDMFLMGL
jgi:hypothetical protein